jgi:capsule polysaccharide export protein KpsE/RkpR
MTMNKDSTATVMQRVKGTEVEVNPQPDIPFEDQTEVTLAENAARRARTAARQRLLWNNRRFLSRTTGAGLIFFTLLAFLLPKRYTATARLMPPDYTSSISNGLAMTALSGDAAGGTSGGGSSLMGFASKLLGFSTSGELIAGVLKSDTLEDRIIQKFGMIEEYRAKYPEDARKALEKDIDIKSDMKTGIITISVENRNPRKASAMAREMVDSLNDLLAQVNTSAAHRERVFIGERLQAVKQELDGATKEFSIFASQNSAINIPDQAKAMVAAAADLQGQLIAAESQLKSLQQIYTDNNVNVRQMKALIAELKSQLNKFGGKDVTPANGSKLSSDELYPSIRQLPLLGVRYLDLFRRSKINEAAFEMLSKEYEVAKVEEAREVPSVAVLDAPTIPQKKSSPHRLVIMLLGTAFSFCLALGIVLGRNGWEEIQTDDPRKILAVEIFSTVRGRLRPNSRNGHGALAHPNCPDGEPDTSSDCIGKERG